MYKNGRYQKSFEGGIYRNNEKGDNDNDNDNNKQRGKYGNWSMGN